MEHLPENERENDGGLGAEPSPRESTAARKSRVHGASRARGLPWFPKKVIKGCDARGDGDSPFLTRWTLLSTKRGSLYLHLFHRSDADELHDHPWSFVSLILWRGYVEEIAADRLHEQRFVSVAEGEDLIAREGWRYGGYSIGDSMNIFRDHVVERRRKRARPGMLLFREAEHAHRVVLIDGKPSLSLVWVSSRNREWGFFTRRGWQSWREYFKEHGC